MSEPHAASPGHPPMQSSAPRCPICGYDLRHDAAGRCPECGSTRQERHEWVYVRGRRHVEWIFLGLAWLVIISIGLPLLFACVLAIAGALGGV